jgi:hypothetical protein
MADKVILTMGVAQGEYGRINRNRATRLHRDKKIALIAPRRHQVMVGQTEIGDAVRPRSVRDPIGRVVRCW